MRSEIAIMMVILAVFCVNAAPLRKLPQITVIESETLSVDSMKATSVRSSNSAVFSAALRESGEAVLSGVRLGEASLDYVNERGMFATRPVTVVPAYWDVLKRMFYDDPEITIDIVGDKVVVGGATANVDTLKRVDQAKALDPSRILPQVSYSSAQIGELVRDFLSRAAISNIAVNVVGREVCLSGRMYDQKSIDQLKARVESFVKEYPGVTVNIDELRMYKQKILINIEFVQYNDSMARNLGFVGPTKIKAQLDWNLGFNHGKSTSDTQTLSGDGSREKTYNPTTSFDSTLPPGSQTTVKSDDKTDLRSRFGKTWERTDMFSRGWNGAANAYVSGVEATINLLKQNGAAKTFYATTLSTQSGIEVEFQNGGTYYERTDAGLTASGGISEIEYGYIIKATPFILDENTINLDLSMDNKQPQTPEGRVERVSRYQTKSKYLMRPGESIALSGYKFKSETEGKQGTPWLSKIPLIGPYLFGNTTSNLDMDEMLLVVKVDWSVEGESAQSLDRFNELKDRKVKVEMP